MKSRNKLSISIHGFLFPDCKRKVTSHHVCLPLCLLQHNGLFSQIVSQKKSSSFPELLYRVSCRNNKEETNVGPSVVFWNSFHLSQWHMLSGNPKTMGYSNLKAEDNKETIQG